MGQRQRIILVIGTLSCMLIGAYIASRIIKSNDPVEIRRKEILDYIDSKIFDRVYDENPCKIDTMDLLLRELKHARTSDELDDIFDDVKKLELSLI